SPSRSPARAGSSARPARRRRARPPDPCGGSLPRHSHSPLLHPRGGGPKRQTGLGLTFGPISLKVEIGDQMSDSESGDELRLDIAASFGAEADTSTQAFSIYVPNKDRDGKEIGNQRQWVLEALRLLGTIGGGATAMPPVEGVWMDAEG